MLVVLLTLLIVPPDAKLETLFDAGVFTEGPASAPDGSIYFSDITGTARSREAGHIMRFDPRTGRVTLFRSPSGMANGMIFDLQGRLVVTEGADTGGRRVSRIDLATGKSERVAMKFRDKLFNSPNDVTIDRRGRIYFTDPRYVGDEAIEQPVQAVYRIDPDGSVARVVADASKPNGIAISPDQKTLYVASTDSGAFGAVGDGLRVASGRMAILAYDLHEDGTARFRKQIVDLAGRGYADGLAVDRAGNVYCGCGPLGVRVFSPDGEEIAAIPVPAETTNVEFGRGADKNLLYITAGKGLYRIRLSAEGFHPAD
jgi:gluconolactonase